MRKSLRVLLSAGAFALAAGCSSISVETVHDPAADFSKYTTYSWIDLQLVSSPTLRSHIETAVDRQLRAKGYRRVDRDADVKVAVHTRFSREVRLSLFSGKWGYGWGWGPPPGYGDRTATTQVQEVPVGTLIVDVVDAGRNELLWRGTATSDLHSEESAEKERDLLEEAVARLFKRYPPKRS